MPSGQTSISVPDFQTKLWQTEKLIMEAYLTLVCVSVSGCDVENVYYECIWGKGRTDTVFFKKMKLIHLHTPAPLAFKPFENFLKLYTVACIVSVILQFVKDLIFFFIPVCKIAFFVHGYIVHIDAIFVLWFGLRVSLYYVICSLSIWSNQHMCIVIKVHLPILFYLPLTIYHQC